MARHILWIGLFTQARSARIWTSDSTTGRRRCLGGRILFFPEQRPVPIEGPTIKELDPAVIGLERAERQAPLPQSEQVDAHLFLAQLVGRPAIVPGKPAHPVQVDALGSQRQPGRPHVLRHPLAQRCHRGLLSFEVRPAAHSPGPPKITSRVPPNDGLLLPYGAAVQSNGRLERWPGFLSVCFGTWTWTFSAALTAVAEPRPVLSLLPRLRHLLLNHSAPSSLLCPVCNSPGRGTVAEVVKVDIPAVSPDLTARGQHGANSAHSG